MFEKIKLYRQNRILRLLTGVTRQKRIVNLDQVREVGILFTVGAEREWNRLYNFARELEKQGKQVHLLGLQGRQTQTDYIFTHTHTSIVHEKEDLTFFGLPKEGVTEAFTSRHYDLLIDFTPDHPFTALYLAARSLADLKATYCQGQPENPYLEQTFDLLIRGDKPLDISEFITHIKQYLSIIKK